MLVEPGRGQIDGDREACGILPVPPVDAGERRGVRAVRVILAVLLVEALGVPAGPRIRLRMHVVVDVRAGPPRVHHAAALGEAVLVLDTFARSEREADRLAAERD